MSTCFLFFNNFEFEDFVSLKITNCNETVPLAKRTVDEIKDLQNNSRTLIVLSASFFGIYEVGLPKVNEQKLRRTLPYALEENLAQNVDEVHFAFDQKFYDGENYLTAIVDKNKFCDFIEKLKSFNISFDAVTIDYFALDKEEVVFTSDGSVLVNDINFKGSLPKELLPVYLNENIQNILSFKDSVIPKEIELALKKTNRSIYEGCCYSWIASRLMERGYLNLCQGEFLIKNKKHTILGWYKISGAFTVLASMSFIVLNLINFNVLSTEIKKVDENIEVIYRDFFPNASSVISPKFRIEQLVKQSQNNNEGFLFVLLNELGLALNNSDYTIEKIDFKNKELIVALVLSDFKALESIETKLKVKKITVNQKQALSSNEKVFATLELKF